jgi:prepilin-type N-terminal cleavage/methylation domain-containing protein
MIMNLRKNQSGFTLPETIIALSLLGLVFAIGCFGFMRLVPGYRLEGAVQNMISDFQLARMKAISQNCSYRIQIIPEKGRYFLERESLSGPSRWPGVREGVEREFNNPSNPYHYPGVMVVRCSANPVFLPRGSVVGTTVVLKNSSGQKTIILSSLGRVKVQEG